MLTNITSTKSYTVGYFKAQSKGTLGVSISVSGDKKLKVLREARELLETALKDAAEFDKKALNPET